MGKLLTVGLATLTAIVLGSGCSNRSVYSIKNEKGNEIQFELVAYQITPLFDELGSNYGCNISGDSVLHITNKNSQEKVSYLQRDGHVIRMRVESADGERDYANLDEQTEEMFKNADVEFREGIKYIKLARKEIIDRTSKTASEIPYK